MAQEPKSPVSVETFDNLEACLYEAFTNLTTIATLLGFASNPPDRVVQLGSALTGHLIDAISLCGVLRAELISDNHLSHDSDD